ncbi:MAG: DUF4249 domain-containing protein [Tannerellaceae bacterium]|jgi:hypothetical protein|nr:DUF4249 domain-containing protein [Tannerellaceae bacterium]
MKKYRFLYIILSMFLGLPACINEYHPAGMEQTGGLLVVDGMITDGESVFKLSYSSGIDDLSGGVTIINNASLYVETGNGKRIEGRRRDSVYIEQDVRSNNPLATTGRMEQGIYTVPTGALDPGKEYRLHISVDGEEYESSFLKPLSTPEIDSLSVSKKGRGEPVIVSVTSHGSGEQSIYYRWSFLETWEVKSEYALWGYFPSGTREASPANLIWFGSLTLKRPDNFYYCWGRDSSKALMIATSEVLAENLIYQHPLITISCDNEKLSILYNLEVYQTAIRKEAYDYFSNMQTNVEQSGSIFSPIPGEINGNIRCLTDPGCPVIGFVEVTSVTRKDIFIPENGLYYEPKYNNDNFRESPCLYERNSPPVLPFLDGLSSIGRACSDCRYKYNAAKNRPPSWPTDHY